MRASLQKDHFVVLDSWRGVCALLVAAFHLDAAAHVYDLPLLRHAYLFVDFFFVLSGFVIAHAYTSRLMSGRDLLSFMVRRFGRIWPLQATLLGALVALEGLKLILYHLSGLKTGRPPFDPEALHPLATIPDHLLLLQAMGLQDKLTWNFPSWSVSAEFWTYLVFATVCVIFPLWKRHIFVSLGLAGGMLVAIFSRHGMDVTYDLGFFRCLLGFMVGSLVYGLREKAWRLLAPCGALAEGGALLAVLAFVWFAGYGPLSFFAPLVFGLATLVFGLEGGPVSAVLSRPAFRSLGDWSYSIYMNHILVLTLIGVVAIVGQKYAGRPFFVEKVDAGVLHSSISNIDPFLLDGLYVAYLAVTVALARWTYQRVERPARDFFAVFADRLASSARRSRESESPATARFYHQAGL